MDHRRAFLAAILPVRALIAGAGGRWGEPSALDGMTIGDLAAHTARAVTNVSRYLDADAPNGPPQVDAAGYFLAVEGLGDPESDTNRGVLARAAEESALGFHAVLDRLDDDTAALTGRLAEEPGERTVMVFGDLVMTLDEYLVTRMVELVVHGDDLAASLDETEPVFPQAVTQGVIDTLTEMARRRHGDAAVVRALTRRERDTIEALRVL